MSSHNLVVPEVAHLGPILHLDKRASVCSVKEKGPSCLDEGIYTEMEILASDMKQAQQQKRRT